MPPQGPTKLKSTAAIQMAGPRITAALVPRTWGPEAKYFSTAMIRGMEMERGAWEDEKQAAGAQAGSGPAAGLQVEGPYILSVTYYVCRRYIDYLDPSAPASLPLHQLAIHPISTCRGTCTWMLPIGLRKGRKRHPAGL